MDKKEILQRAQRENQDDGMAAAENRGRKYGFSAFCIPRFAFTRKKSDLVLAILTTIAAAAALAAYVVSVVRGV